MWVLLITIGSVLYAILLIAAMLLIAALAIKSCKEDIPKKDEECSMCKGGMYETCRYFKSESYKKALKALKEKKAQKEKSDGK